jgi:hypothetical protein
MAAAMSRDQGTGGQAHSQASSAADDPFGF